MRHRLLWQLYPAFLAVSIGALLVVGLVAARSIYAIHRDSLRDELEARAHMLARMIPLERTDESMARMNAMCREVGELTNTRLTIVWMDGQVLGDTQEDPSRMERHHTRPEVGAALAGRIGESVRFSATTGETRLYVAAPIVRGDVVVGAARVSIPLAAVRAQQHALRQRLVFGGGVAAALAAVLAGVLAKRITRPIERMRRVAEQYAVGDLDARMVVEGPEEMARLAEVLNRMGSDLQNRINAVVEQRNERETVLAAMSEGVFTVHAGPDERIRDCNAAAARLLHTTPPAACGRPLGEVVRNSTLQQLVRRTLQQAQAGECDLVFRVPKERFVQARCVPLSWGGEEQTDGGALVVMTDVTRIKRLETIRRDFVANVSHELKTPITSIRGACETLLDEGGRAGHEATRFLEIIHRQAGRLESMVEDLLSLSRIEYSSERDTLRREPGPIRPVLEAAVTACRKRADTRGVRLVLICEGSLTAPINAPLLEQAVVNLVDNAVKFSPPDGDVRVEGNRAGPRLHIRVIDAGPGISPEHHERIFERFYCVDPGRSRTLGGTGLGLAIVKHIALVHGGTVRIESEPGRGSTFILDLPAAG